MAFVHSNEKLEIHKLNKRRNLMLLALSCEKMLPTFKSFSIDEKYDMSIYAICMDLAYNYIDRKDVSIDGGMYYELCIERAPDTEMYQSSKVAIALSSAISIANMMKFIENDDTSLVIDVLQLRLDAVSLNVQDKNVKIPYSVNLESLESHPMIRKENDDQTDDISFVKNIDEYYPKISNIIKQRGEYQAYNF